ncbi:uncharacterized protein [Anoplolepis gracilipes]|uniref:uncharacterized protein isoform X2 n=1 Tax=Anoplolepis gracilipes TaxID=354296 RepID=UPI003BA1082E
MMDCTVKNLEKTFDVKQKALVNKLHNMQWLKNMPPSSNLGKVQIIYKHIQDYDKNNKLEDEGLLTENIKEYSIEESDKNRSMATYKRYLSNDAIPGSDENIWDKDVNLFSNSNKLINQKDRKKKEDMLMITESLLTTKLDAQFDIDKMQKDQSNILQNNTEDITQNAASSNLSNLETKSNKTDDVTMAYKNKNISINKDGILNGGSKQQTDSKQSVSKYKRSVQESLKKSTSTVNYVAYKDKMVEKTVTTVSKNSDLLLNKSKKINKKIVNGKHFQRYQKADRDFNLQKSSTLEYKNSTFTKPVHNKSMRNIEYTSTFYGRNSSYNDPKFDNQHISYAERKSVIKSEYTPTNVFSKSNVRTEKLGTKNLENHVTLQNEMSHMQSITDVKSSIRKEDTLAYNNESNVNLVNTKTYLTEGKKCANLNIDHIRKQEPMLGQCNKEMKSLDKFKPNINQQNIETNNTIVNEQTNSFKHSSNLLSNKCIVETPADAIYQHSLNLEYTQCMDNVKKLGSSQIICNNCSSNNAVQKNATINSQQSIQNMCFNIQQTITQERAQTRHMPSWESNSSKFYNQQFSISNAIRRPSQTPNTFKMSSYESNVQTSNNSDVTSMLKTETDCSKENTNVSHKYTPNVQQRSDTIFSDFTHHSVLSGQTGKWNCSVQDGFRIDRYNTMPVYNSGNFDDDLNNTHILNGLSRPMTCASSPNVQTQNPQLQYPLPVFYNSSCMSYIRVIPNTTDQVNNFNSIDPMHNQIKYIPCMQMNNYIRDTRSDPSKYAVQPRNTVDNVSMKSSQHYKKCQDNSRMVYNLSRCVTSLSHSEFQQDMNFMPGSINQCNNAYFWQNQKSDNQNTVNYMQISKYSKNQTIQDLVCDDNESEIIPPIISPKEFITNNASFLKKID